MGPGAWGLGPGAWGLGFGAWGLGPGGLGPGAWGLGAWGNAIAAQPCEQTNVLKGYVGVFLWLGPDLHRNVFCGYLRSGAQTRTYPGAFVFRYPLSWPETYRKPITFLVF